MFAGKHRYLQVDTKLSMSLQFQSPGTFLLTEISKANIGIRALISNDIYVKQWDVIRAWVSDYISCETTDVIHYLCPNLS